MNPVSLRKNWLFTVIKPVNAVVMAPKTRYQVQWNVHGALAGVERRKKMAEYTEIGAYWSTALATSESWATERNFIESLTTFSLLDLRLSLDYGFPINNI